MASMLIEFNSLRQLNLCLNLVLPKPVLVAVYYYWSTSPPLPPPAGPPHLPPRPQSRSHPPSPAWRSPPSWCWSAGGMLPPLLPPLHSWPLKTED